MSLSYSETETDFINKIKADLCVFVDKSSAYSVLVFPPVNSYFRFLIHQLVQENFNQLRTFSIGEDPDRRIVVCTKELVERVDKPKDVSTNVKAVEQTKTFASKSIMVVNNGEKSSCIQVKKTKSSLPTIGIYRPPAARKCEEPIKSSTVPAPIIAVDDACKETVKNKQSRARVRRPDQQVYVPRAKRVLDVPEKHVIVSESTQNLECDKSSAPLIIGAHTLSKRRSLSPNTAPTSLPSRASQLVETKKKLCQSTSLSDMDWEGDVNIHSESETSATMSVPPQNLPPRAEVLVEKKKKLCQSNSSAECNDWKGERSVCSVQTSDVIRNSEKVTRILSSNSVGGNSNRTSVVPKDNSCVEEVCEKESSSVISVEVTNIESNEGTVALDTRSSEVSPQGVEINTNSLVVPENISNSSGSAPQLCGNEVDLSDDDFQDAVNKSKPDCFNDMLDVSSGSSESLSSGDSVNLPVTPVQLIKPVKSDTTKMPSSSKCTRIFNPDECDWDALLDEDGEVLDPFLMKELTSAVGEVQISQPQSDYRNYRSQVPPDHQKTRRSLADDDFNHVVEIYSFPKEFKTNDLVAVFSPFKNTGGGFEIKWVDDTHALGVFSSALVAEQVLEYHHPMVRTRPLCEGTLESRLKARRLSESIQSFRPRPETCAALARRLVTGALGVKLATARQEREEEKRVLREAREKRRLAAKQRDDIWNNG